MCGIIGIVNKSKKPVTQTDITAALSAISHRGPDGHGVFLNQNVGLGNCRLSIIDPHTRSDQPLRYKNYIISFNGAIYNYVELKEELLGLGHEFKTASDTEVILASYDEWGENCLNRFNGMWSFCIYNEKDNSIFCSRDRYGIKPFYYIHNQNGFYFASEIKALLSMQGISSILNPSTVFRFLAFGEQDYSGATMFEGIHQLPAGSMLHLNPKTFKSEIHSYYTLPTKTDTDLTFQEAKRAFKELFYDAIKLRFRADVRIGSSLSGGLDSSSILASIYDQKLADNDFCSLTAYYTEKGFDERKYSNLIINKTGSKNLAFSPSMDSLLDEIDKIIYFQDEPIPSAGVWLQHKLFGHAKSHALKVMIDGQGGDEILAGYDIFHYTFLKNLFRSSPVNGLKEFYYLIFQNSINYKKALQNYKRYVSKKQSSDLSWYKFEVNDHMGREYTEESMSDISRRLLRGMGINALLHYEDRNSMAHSIESRLVFLDHRLVDFCLSLPDSFKIHNGRRKHLLRESLDDILPAGIRNRKDKMGFEIPYVQWMKEHQTSVNALYSESLNNLSFLDTAKLRNVKDLGFKWRIIMLQKWIECFNVHQP